MPNGVVVTYGRTAADLNLGSLRFYPPTAGDDDYATLVALPAGFGNGEFTLGFFCRLNGTDQVAGSGVDDWWNGNATPYSAADWWYRGNFLIDGHNNTNFYDGTFSVQVFNSGRLRWLFGDGAAANARTGDLHAVQDAAADSLLDGQWHWVELVRRNSGASSSTLELWVDHALVASETSTARTAMYTTYWDDWAGYPANQDGWFLGAEKQSALGTISEWEKFAGDVTELCFWTRAKSAAELGSAASRFDTTNMVGRYRMPEPVANAAPDSLNAGGDISLIPQSNPAWTTARP